MAITGWLLDKSAAARASDPGIGPQLAGLAGDLFICPIGELEQLYSARSGSHFDALKSEIGSALRRAEVPPDVLDRALVLQHDLAHHHGMWHRTPIPDLIIAVVALHCSLGVVHLDRHYERIAEVRPLKVRRLG